MADTPAAKGPVALTSAAHKGKRIKDVGSADHIAKNHFAKVYTPEFRKAGTDYPIIFVKDPESDNFFAAGMWGLEVGENLFVQNGRWLGGYYPASVRCYPFAVAPDPENNERLFIGIYEEADVVDDNEGNLIFNDDGTETDWMKEVKEFLVNVYRQEDMTRQFVSKLRELDLLQPQTLSIKNAKTGKDHEVSGFFVVDREKLEQLPDDKYMELRKGGALEVIYNHLMSLDSLDKLLRIKNTQAPGEEAPADANLEATPAGNAAPAAANNEDPTPAPAND